jgi:hypothetical protein
MNKLIEACGFSLVNVAIKNSSDPFLTYNDPFYLEDGARTTLVKERT